MTLKTDKLHQWSTKSIKVLFKSTNKSIGNGEDKLAKELGIATTIGGQNSTHDLKHLKLGKISVKDMTKSDCTLGTDCTQEMRKIFRKVIIPFILWVEKYESSCELATFFQNSMNKKHGSSKITVLEGIDRYELSKANLLELNKNLEKFKDKKEDDGTSYRSLNSEYTDDIIKNMGGMSLQEMLNSCVRKEAIDKTLVIVYENRGWIIVKDYSKLSCPRITRGAPRINYS